MLANIEQRQLSEFGKHFDAKDFDLAAVLSKNAPSKDSFMRNTGAFSDIMMNSKHSKGENVKDSDAQKAYYSKGNMHAMFSGFKNQDGIKQQINKMLNEKDVAISVSAAPAA